MNLVVGGSWDRAAVGVLGGCGCAVLALVVLAGCSTVGTRAVSPAGASDLAARASYSWLEPPIELGDHQTLDRRTDLLRESRRLINRELAAKGYREVPVGEGEMRVSRHLAISTEFTDQGLNSRYAEKLAGELEAGGFRVADWLEGGGRERPYRKGTLVVDVIDGESPTLLWRGSAQARIDTRSSAIEDGFPRLAGAIEDILAKFPERSTE